MSKPIGHKTCYTINDGSLLDSFQEKYGSTFELMTRREKLFLISAIAAQLRDQSPGQCREKIYIVRDQVNSSLTLHDREGLLEAMINQVRCSSSLPEFEIKSQKIPKNPGG